MTNPLLNSLGLNDVKAKESDNGNPPDGPYNGIVSKSEIFVKRDGSKVSHLIEYTVKDAPKYNGYRKSEFFELGTNPVYDGTPANRLVSFTPTMDDEAKSWYKKRWVDLGIPEEEIGTSDFSVLLNKLVTFGMKTKNEWQNVSYVRLREKTAGAGPIAGPANAAQINPQPPVGLTPGEQIAANQL